jgi:hypothetical protein
MFPWRQAAAHIPAPPVEYDRQWRAVTQRKPCPICGKPDWCTVTNDAAICMRVADGAIRSIDMDHGTGYLHRLTADTQIIRPTYSAGPTEADFELDYDAIFRRWSRDTTDAAIVALAQSLGVSGQALKRLEPAWCAERECWAFPMHDDRRQVIGVRLRADGAKFAVTSSKSGLFIPTGLNSSSPLFICEGPTDTAAALTLEVEAIGRPSCSGGTEHLCNLLQVSRRRDVTIIADNDGPGRAGGKRLADRIVGICRSVTLFTAAPHKDLRAWLRAGCTPAILWARVGNAKKHGREWA